MIIAILILIIMIITRVSEQSKVNCMDSKNLAICWWPTLLQVVIIIIFIDIIIIGIFIIFTINVVIIISMFIPYWTS